MTNPWVCTECGNRQAAEGKCGACGNEPTLDARDEQVRELMADIDLRIGQKREGRFRLVGVVIGMVAIFATWMIPNFWEKRSENFALPFLLDQWILMALIGYGVSKGLEKLYAKKRFPYLDVNQQIVE